MHPSENQRRSHDQSPNKTLPLLIIGFLSVILIALFLICGYLFLRKGRSACSYEGVFYSDGDSFDALDGCNRCTCKDGDVLCTEKACERKCIGAGEKLTLDKGEVCCKGLIQVDNCSFSKGKCLCSDSNWARCLPCGDGTCGSDENFCNCPEDCNMPEGGEDGTEDNNGSDENDDISKVDLYYYKALEPQHNHTVIDKVTRETDEENLTSYIILSLINGPTPAELSNGYIKIFSFSGGSTCCGNLFQYVRSGSTLKIKLCKTIEPVLDADSGYPGISLNAQKRVIYSFQQSLKIDGITKVKLFDKEGKCYSPDSGVNQCEWEETY